MRKFILLTEKRWHDELFEYLLKRENEDWIRINKASEFNTSTLREVAPNKIFVPHWSHIIPESIWSAYECVVFHMTDLPYGRGGSPLQNLIVRGHRTTKITALRVNQGIDTGDIYCKSELDLTGSAREIFGRSAVIIRKMIESIIDADLEPYPQKGDPVHFKRRSPKDGSIDGLPTLEEVYDYIRMLDADDYPRAFLEVNSLRFEFENAVLDKNQSEIRAHVSITKK